MRISDWSSDVCSSDLLTLSPALCALFLDFNPEHGAPADGQHNGSAGNKKKQGFIKRFFAAFNIAFNAITAKYIASLRFLFRKNWVALSGLALVTAVTFIMLRNTQTGFIPTEAQGFLRYAVNTPPGSSLERNNKTMKQTKEI